LVAALCLAVGTGLAARTAVSGAPGKGTQVADPSKVDVDYAIQGEYTGRLNLDEGPPETGVQVVALGEGNFLAVVHRGGLPGVGWDKGPRDRIEGKRENGKAIFQGDGAQWVIEDGALKVTSDNGRSLGQLKRVARTSPTLGQKPPLGAIVLFDGTSTDEWVGVRGGPAEMRDGLLHQGANSRRTFGSHRVHIEFRLPYQPGARGQGRGNSGIYLQGRYEVQMLDSFGLEGKDNECGGIYEIRDPELNMCLPPLQWQTYDIEFTQAEFDESGKKTANAKLTVYHNGTLIHKDVDVPRTTRAAPVGAEGTSPGFLHLQDHGNPVRYRNIWVVETQ
jgi:hypothetical protein